jgi:hypothetical protein
MKARAGPVKEFQNPRTRELARRRKIHPVMKATIAFSVLCLALVAEAGAADVWRWIDRFGYTHYTVADDIPQRYRATAVPASAPLPPGTSACEAAWHRFAASQACFEAYRVVGGGLKAEAFQRCKEMPEPEPCR